jgi:hypothetical protein
MLREGSWMDPVLSFFLMEQGDESYDSRRLFMRCLHNRWETC